MASVKSALENAGQAGTRVVIPVEVRGLLRQFVEGDVPVTLTSPGLTPYATSLWAEDMARDMIVFAADVGDPRVRALVQTSQPVIVVGDLEGVKIQFAIRELVTVQGLGASALNAAYPSEVVRFQRRGGFRVQPLGTKQPTARLVWSDESGQSQSIRLRLLDVSHHGVALFWPKAIGAVPEIGASFESAQLDLDAQIHVLAALRVVRHEASTGKAPGWRLGLEIVSVRPDAERLLQRYLDLAQKRRSLLTL